MAKRTDITAAQVREILDYNPETGEFRWKDRPPEMSGGSIQSQHHTCARINSRFSGKIAGKIVDGYRRICIFYVQYPAHRLAWLIMTDAWPSCGIDHINLDRSDNRWANLREATPNQNSANVRSKTNNLKGAYWIEDKHKWRSNITVNGKTIYLGLFPSEKDAHEAYCNAAKRFFGEFARFA